LRSKLNSIFSETNAAPTRGTGPDSVRKRKPVRRDSDLLLEEEASAALIPGFLPAAEAGAAGALVASLP
jgi:hypothetical protein